MVPRADDGPVTTPPALPAVPADLPARLSAELDPARPRQLVVTAVHPRADGGLDLDVTCGQQRERRRLTYATTPQDLESLGEPSFVLTLRANLEEWWDTGQADGPALRTRRDA